MHSYDAGKAPTLPCRYSPAAALHAHAAAMRAAAHSQIHPMHGTCPHLHPLLLLLPPLPDSLQAAALQRVVHLEAQQRLCALHALRLLRLLCMLLRLLPRWRLLLLGLLLWGLLLRLGRAALPLLPCRAARVLRVDALQ